MKIKVLFLAAVLLTAFVLMSGTALAAGFSGGDGSIDNPFLISAPADLQEMADYSGQSSGKYFVLTQSIDLSDYLQTNTWMPIGFWEPFRGTFNGGGNTISGLRINEPFLDGAGLFGYVDGAVFSDIILTDISIIAGNEIGGFAGNVNNSSFSNITLTNVSVTGTRTFYVGGLAGYVTNSSITNCSVSGVGPYSVTVTVPGEAAGGLAGAVENSSITYCSVFGDGPDSVKVSTGMVAGGLAGYVSDSRFTVCSVSGVGSDSVTITVDTEEVGGLAGRLSAGSIQDCYSEAAVEGTEYVGGLVGRIAFIGSGSSAITHSYFAGAIQLIGGAQTNGGLYGGLLISGANDDELEIVDSFYLTGAAGDYDNPGGTPISDPADMKKIETFTLPAGQGGFLEEGAESWDISTDHEAGSVWFIIEGEIYPIFTLMYVPPDDDNRDSNGGGGSGFGEAKVVDSAAGTSGSENTAFGISDDLPDTTGVTDMVDTRAGDSYSAETESGNDWILYLLIIIGFILLFFIILFLIKRRRDDDEEDQDQLNQP